jgi:type II secretory pathway pseudopilin PulG
MNSFQNNRRGVSLVETVITIAVFVLIMGAVAASLIYFYRSNAYTVEQSSAITAARRGVETMVQDLREATFSAGGAYPIVSMGGYDLTAYSDIDHDADVERIRFFLDGTNLKRQVTNPTSTPAEYTGSESTSILASDVRNQQNNTPIFTYVDADGAAVTSASNISAIKSVEVNLVVNVDINRSPRGYTIRSQATMRNM